MIARINYLLIKKWLADLAEDADLTEDSLTRDWFHAVPLLEWADDVEFSKADTIRPTFPQYVASLPGKDGRPHLSSESQKKIAGQAKRFFTWAAFEQRSEFRSINSKYLKSLKRNRMSDETGEFVFVDLETAIKLATIPVDDNTLALRRDRAASAMLYLTGARATAFSTAPICAFDMENLRFMQWPILGVQTKFGRKGTTAFWRIDPLIEAVMDEAEIERRMIRLGSQPKWHFDADLLAYMSSLTKLEVREMMKDMNRIMDLGMDLLAK